MRFENLELGPRLLPFVVPEGTAQYRRTLRSTYVMTWRTYRDAWKMHVLNRQLDVVGGRTGLGAINHCVAQAKRAEVLADLLGLSPELVRDLITGVLITYSYKRNEQLYMQEAGPSWDSYAHAQVLARQSWEESGLFDVGVMALASSVAHETLLLMEELCDKAEKATLKPFGVARLIAHYVDDISRDHAWVTEADEHGKNVLDLRMLRNANNPTYARLNEEGRVRLRQEAVDARLPQYFTGYETTYEAQARVGHRVEGVLAQLLYDRLERDFNRIDLPVIVDNALRRGLGLAA